VSLPGSIIIQRRSRLVVRACVTGLVCLIGRVGIVAAQGGQPVPADASACKANQAHLSRLEPALVALVDELGTTPARDVAGRVPMALGDTVPVTIRFDLTQAERARADLAAYGVQPANEIPGEIEAYVSVSVLTQLAALDSIDTVALIVPPQASLVVSQGATVHNAVSWQSGALAGSGVKVGVIDVGFQGILALLGNELPSAVTARCYTSVGIYVSTIETCDAPYSQTPHGTAVAETVLDVAPSVELYIANPQSPQDVQATVQWMTSQGVRVINHSVIWTWDGPGDGTSPFLSSPLYAVDVAVAGGAVWTNAAGNEARATWTGSFLDANGNDLAEFSSGVERNGVYLQAGRTYVAQLRWDDSWSAAARDLDLYLYDSSSPSPVASSLASQDGVQGQIPYERLVYVPQVSGFYYLVVHHFGGQTPLWIDLQSFTGESLEVFSSAYSISNPGVSANPGLLAVGAAAWSSTSVIETFSSLGPTRDGRVKPDLVGADRGDSATYGVFAGTSQAAPHVAGLAALVMGAFPGTPPSAVADYLRYVASARSPANTWGAGFAQVPLFPSQTSLSALLSDKPLPVTVGTTVTWRAYALGPGRPFEYQFWVLLQGVGWTIGQAYSPSNTFVWTPPVQGAYALQVWTRRIGSTAAFEDWRGTGSLSVTQPSPVQVTSLTSYPQTSVITQGTQVTWIATATGGTPPLQYQFWRLRQGVGWTMVQDYSPNSSFAWIPAPTDAGTYTMQVWVRSTGSSAAYDDWRSSADVIVQAPPPVIVTIDPSATFSTPAYSTLTFTATGSGGGQPLVYQFWRFKFDPGVWTLIQDYSPVNTYSWTPTASDTGAYAIQVWARTATSTAPFDAWAGTAAFDVVSAAPPRVTTLAANVSFPTTAGTPITWTVTAQGGPPPISYMFFLLDTSTGVWTVLQDYSPVESVTWAARAGDYVMQVWVNGTGTGVAYTDYRSQSFSVVNASQAIATSLALVGSSPVTIGNSLTWAATADSGTAPLQYQFWRLREGVGWTMVQDYSPSATYAWTPASGDEGMYAVQVWVRSAGSVMAYEDWRASDKVRVVPSTVLRLNGQQGEWIVGRNDIVLTPADVMVTAVRNASNGISVSASSPSEWYSLDFAAPNGSTLVPGVYAATRFPFQAAEDAGLSITGIGRACNEVWGRFVVIDVAYDAGGAIERFAADFEQHCEGVATALVGSVRIASVIPVTPNAPLRFSGASPSKPGLPLAWTALPRSPGREYEFWRYSQSSHTWSLMSSYGTGAIVVWTPASSDVGSYLIEAWERPEGSARSYERLQFVMPLTITP